MPRKYVYFLLLNSRICLPGVPKKMFISELFALLANENFFGTPCTYFLDLHTFVLHCIKTLLSRRKHTLPLFGGKGPSKYEINTTYNKYPDPHQHDKSLGITKECEMSA